MERSIEELVMEINKSTAEMAKMTERIKRNNEEIDRDLKIIDKMLKELLGEDKAETNICNVAVDKLIEDDKVVLKKLHPRYRNLGDKM